LTTIYGAYLPWKPRSRHSASRGSVFVAPVGL
jgi:hypothetical protein